MKVIEALKIQSILDKREIHGYNTFSKSILKYARKVQYSFTQFSKSTHDTKNS